jgi:hypothetical protein
MFLNVGAFESGIWHGSVPSKALLKIQIGFTQNYTPADILELCSKVVA